VGVDEHINPGDLLQQLARRGLTQVAQQHDHIDGRADLVDNGPHGRDGGQYREPVRQPALVEQKRLFGRGPDDTEPKARDVAHHVRGQKKLPVRSAQVGRDERRPGHIARLAEELGAIGQLLVAHAQGVIAHQGHGAERGQRPLAIDGRALGVLIIGATGEEAAGIHDQHRVEAALPHLLEHGGAPRQASIRSDGAVAGAHHRVCLTRVGDGVLQCRGGWRAGSREDEQGSDSG